MLFCVARCHILLQYHPVVMVGALCAEFRRTTVERYHARQHGASRFSLYGFSRNLVSIFRKKYIYLSRKFNFPSEYDKNNGYFTCRPMYIYDISRWILLIMRNVSYKSCRENRNTHFVFGSFLLRNSCRLWDNVGKYCRAGQAADVSIIRRMRVACWITKATKHALRMCNACFLMHGSSGCTNASHRLQVHCLSCYFIHCLLIDHGTHGFDIDMFE